MLFSQVIGHDAIKEKLRQSKLNSRVSHAQIFLGENGTGALPLALAYAQFVNCTDPGPEDSCGQCSSCRKMMALEHPDLHFSFPCIPLKSGKAFTADFIGLWRKTLLEDPYLTYPDWMQKIEAENKQGNISADEIRAIIRKLSLKPLYEGFKILVLWMPEYMGNFGNMLLKSLEEPPENTLYLLVAENEEKILPTILSRTQMLRVPRIKDADLRKALAKELEIGEDEARRVSYMAEGNYHKAMIFYKEGENDYTEEFVNWMRMCFKPDMGGLLKWVDKMAATGRENQKNFLAYGLNLLRECLLQSQELPQLLRVLDSERDFVTRFAALVTTDNITGLSEVFSKAHYHVERNANPKILLFNLSLQVNGLLKGQKPARDANAMAR